MLQLGIKKSLVEIAVIAQLFAEATKNVTFGVIFQKDINARLFNVLKYIAHFTFRRHLNWANTIFLNFFN